uniref:BTB/POZ domain-containing protein n=1 Tax=Taeniopygia guttata TaxID=59729 RepID=A0A674HRX8_TAEGU
STVCALQSSRLQAEDKAVYTARHEALYCFKNSMMASMFSGCFPLKLISTMLLRNASVSYWRVPQELTECETLKEHPLRGSWHHMPPVYKRLLIDCTEAEGCLPCKVGLQPIRFSGPSTSTHIKVKNSSLLKVSDTAQRSFSNHIHNMHISAQQVPGSLWKAECCNGPLSQLPFQALGSKKPMNNCAVKLKRTPLFLVALSQPPSSASSKAREQSSVAVEIPTVLNKKEPAVFAESITLKIKWMGNV